MNSTPAPQSTACAAATIWSGVGEVKTWPGQAASSMPTPTKPACSGSWPEPPPEISATLPARVGVARVTKVGSKWTLTRSPCAAPKPRSASVSTSSTRLTASSCSAPPVVVGRLGALGEPDDARGEVQDHRLDLARGRSASRNSGTAMRSSCGADGRGGRRARSGWARDRGRGTARARAGARWQISKIVVRSLAGIGTV